MLSEKQSSNRRSAVVALCAILICISGCISYKAEPLPFVIQNMFIILTAAVLGGIQAGGAAGLVLAAGAIGLPIFSHGGGIQYISHSLEGGFILGYFVGALVTGFYIGTPSPKEKTPLKKIIIGCFLGFLVIYIPGIFHMFDTLDDVTGLMYRLIPYVIGDGIKCIIAIVAAHFLRPIAARFLFTS